MMNRILSRSNRVPDGHYAWFVAALLSMSYAVAFIDRQVLNLLVEPIKLDLGLTDIQISLLQGLAFVGAYVAMGPVFGWLADRGNRRNLLIAGIGIWCISTALCGFADSFWSLFVARAGIGAAPCCLFLPFAPTYWSALVASAIGSFFVNFSLPMAAAALQASTPNRMRGLVTSAYAFVLTSAGLGLAPTFIAFVTDQLLNDTARVGTSLGWVTGLSALLALPLLVGASRRYAAHLGANGASPAGSTA